MVCADLNVERGGFPIEEIAEGTYKYRTTASASPTWAAP